MTAPRRLAVIAGALYLATFVTSIPALLLKAPVHDDPAFVLGAGRATGVLVAGLLELLLAVACVGTALALFPIVRRHSEPVALGFLAARVLEAAIIGVGVIGLLSVLTLRNSLGVPGGAEAPHVVVTASAMVAMHDWAFLLGPGLLPAVNAVLLGSVLYRTRLVPRLIPACGLVGAPLLVGSMAATMFGLWDQVSVVAAVAAAPIILWELSLGLWLVARGFEPAALARLGPSPQDASAARAGGPLQGVQPRG